LNLPTFERPLAIRSAFSSEDSAEDSFAGYFESVLSVPVDDPAAIASAFKTVLESASRQKKRIRRDILVMEMVAAKHAGVAFTESEHEDDLVNYVEGTAQDLMGGTVQGKSLRLSKLRNYEMRLRGEALPLWQARLQTLLKQVRRWLDTQDGDIEWADDGERCYLLQLRPVTRPTRRDEAFTIANHKEILPELPSTFMTSVIESCAMDLFRYYRRFDPSLPSSRPFIEVFYGRPYINLSLMSEMMRVFGLPTRLVTDNIGGETDRVYGLNSGRVLRKTLSGTLPRFAFAQLTAVGHVRRTTAKMDARLADLGGDLADLVEAIRWLYTALVTEMFNLTAAIGPMLSLLRSSGTLAEHTTRHQTISSRMYTDLDPLRERVRERPDLVPALERGEVPDDAAFRALWQDYIATYGHRGIYESDIARPRYANDPTPLLQSLTTPPAPRRPAPRRTSRGLLTLPLWWQAGRAIRAREQWRHDAMRGFNRIRQALLARAETFVEDGVLPYVEALWMMTVDEVTSLEGGWQPDRDFFMERRREIARLKTYHLPDLFHRFDDLEAYRELPPGEEPRLRLSGISLTTGEVTGRAWVLDEPSVTLPEDFNESATILVARSVDAGWIPTFSRVAGVVVETGGDLSHGSIILREIGLPAVTNIQGATRQFHTGDLLTLDARQGVVERTEALDSTPV
jgi:pyruvate,water dikinase